VFKGSQGPVPLLQDPDIAPAPGQAFLCVDHGIVHGDDANEFGSRTFVLSKPNLGLKYQHDAVVNFAL
jgi:hypothetical protein